MHVRPAARPLELTLKQKDSNCSLLNESLNERNILSETLESLVSDLLSFAPSFFSDEVFFNLISDYNPYVCRMVVETGICSGMYNVTK